MFSSKYGVVAGLGTNWPLYDFVATYGRCGSQKEVLEWISNQQKFLNFGFGQAQGGVGAPQPPQTSPPSGSDRPLPQLKIPNWLSHDETLVVIAPSVLPSLTIYFPDVTEQMAHRWKKAYKEFDPKSPNLALRDYCAYVAANRIHFTVLGAPNDNYCLFMLSPPTATMEALRTLKDKSRKLTFDVIAATMGRIVYRNLNIDPVTVAANLKIGMDGCLDKKTLFMRVVELHYCQNVQLDLELFRCHVVYNIGIYMPDATRDHFFKKVEETYPTLFSVGSLISADDESLDSPLIRSDQRLMPSNPAEVHQFCSWVIRVANRPVPMYEDKKQSWLTSRVHRPEVTRVIDEARRRTWVQGNTRVQSSMERGIMGDAQVFAARAQSNAPREKRPRDRCTFCGKMGHTEERCYARDPGLRPAPNAQGDIGGSRTKRGAIERPSSSSDLLPTPMAAPRAIISSVEIKCKDEEVADPTPEETRETVSTTGGDSSSCPFQ